MTKIYQATDIGHRRQTNEDAIACVVPDTYIVADGMGGELAGEVASRMFVQVTEKMLTPDMTVDEAVLRRVVETANEAILSTSAREYESRTIGTTATMLHCSAGRGVWAHVGDSRLYLWRGGHLTQLTQDHSYVAGLVASGAITPLEARRHKERNKLMRAVGVAADLAVDTGTISLESGDLLLLCSDGLTSVLLDETIGLILANPAIEDKAKALVEQALKADCGDNVSVLVVLPDVLNACEKDSATTCSDATIVKDTKTQAALAAAIASMTTEVCDGTHPAQDEKEKTLR